MIYQYYKYLNILISIIYCEKRYANKLTKLLVHLMLFLSTTRLGCCQASEELQVEDALDWISLKLSALALPKHIRTIDS